MAARRGKSNGRTGPFNLVNFKRSPPTSGRLYFGVELAGISPTEDFFDPVTYLEAKYNHTPFLDRPIMTPTCPRDSSRFLQLEKSGGFVDGETRAEIHAVVRGPEPELMEPVKACVELHAERLATELQGEGTPAQVELEVYSGQVNIPHLDGDLLRIVLQSWFHDQQTPRA